MRNRTIKLVIIICSIALVAILGMMIVFAFLAKESVDIFNDASKTIKSQTNYMAETLNSKETQTNDMTEAEKEAFNAKFEAYVMENLRGTNVNALIETVKVSNKIKPDREVRIKANVKNWNKEDNRAIPQSMYNVSSEYDSEGYIKYLYLEDAE